MTQASLPKVLIVDDERANRHVLAMMLRRIGHDCTDARDGSEAVHMIASGAAFGIVIMDLQMPGMDGFEATRRIRALTAGKQPYLPIVALTSVASDPVRRAAFDAGMDDFMAKPAEIRSLRAKLNMWVEVEPQSANPPALSSVASQIPVAPDFTALDGVPSFDAGVLRQLHILGQEVERPVVVTTAELVLKELPSNVDAMAEALQDSDARSLHCLAHRLAGAARNIGANHLADLSAELERLTKQLSGPSVRPRQADPAQGDGTRGGPMVQGKSYTSVAPAASETVARVVPLVRMVTLESRHVESVLREFLGGPTWA